MDVNLSDCWNNTLPDELSSVTVRSASSMNQQAFQWSSGFRHITQPQWENFVKDPNAMVIRAKAYHPRNYRNNNYFPGMFYLRLWLWEKIMFMSVMS